MYRKIHAVLEYLLARDRSQRKHHTLFLSLLSNFFQSCHFPVQGCLCLQSLHASGILSTSLLSPVPHCCHYLCVTFSTWVSAYQICDKLTILSFLYRIKSHGAGRSCFINLYSHSLIHKWVSLLQKEIRSAIKCLETALEDMVSVVKMSLLG